jgi:hypothetical protein
MAAREAEVAARVPEVALDARARLVEEQRWAHDALEGVVKEQ